MFCGITLVSLVSGQLAESSLCSPCNAISLLSMSMLWIKVAGKWMHAHWNYLKESPLEMTSRLRLKPFPVLLGDPSLCLRLLPCLPRHHLLCPISPVWPFTSCQTDSVVLLHSNRQFGQAAQWLWLCSLSQAVCPGCSQFPRLLVEQRASWPAS